MEKHFCNCPATDCPRHPTTHNHGCDPCMKDNIIKKKMPACMFLAVHKDVSELTDYTIQGFIDFFMKHRDTYLEGKSHSVKTE